MFAYPDFLLAHGHAGWQHPIEIVAWVSAVPGADPGLDRGRRRTSRCRARALARGRAEPRWRRGRVAVVLAMKAVIMAGGEGTRLRPLTSNQPKPMLPMANRPMMEHVVNLLRQHGFEDIVVTVAFMANAIRSYFGDGSEFGVRMVYATEETPLGTAGSVRNARDELDERFLVISGDVLTDIDLTAARRLTTTRRAALATIALKAVDNPLEFGIVITRDDGSIERFLEKPTWGQVFSDTINTGIYVLEPEIFDFIPEGRPVDFSEEVFPGVLEAEQAPVRLRGRRLLGGRRHPRGLPPGPPGHPRRERRGPGERLRRCAPGCGWARAPRSTRRPRSRGPAIIGDNCHIGRGRRPRRVLRDRRQRPHRGQRRRSSAPSSTTTPSSGSGVRLDGCVLGRSCDLRQGVRCEEGVVLGDESFVGAHAVIKSGVKVYPFKTVEAGATVNTSIVWESRGARIALRPARASPGWPTSTSAPSWPCGCRWPGRRTLEKGATITASRDTSRAARVLKRAIMVGCNAAGVNVEDLEVATVPVTRFQVALGPEPGRHHRPARSSTTPSRSMIRFFDQDGIDIAEAGQRKIERLYHREEFRRALASEIGDIGFPPRALELYTAALMRRRRRRRHRPGRVQDGPRLLVRDRQLRDAQRAGQAGGRGPGGEPLRRHRRRSWPATAPAAAERVADLVRASGAHLGAVIDPGRRAPHPGRRRGPGPHRRPGPAAAPRPGGRPRPGAPRWPCRWRRRMAAEQICAEAGAEIMWTKLSATHLMEVASTGGVTFAASQIGGLHLPALPARLRRGGHPGPPAGHAGAHRRAALEAGEPAARRPHRPRGGASPRGSRRARSCAPWWSGPRAATSSSSTASRCPRPTGGPWWCPTPRSRSPTCGPRRPATPRPRARAQEHAIRIRQMLQ